jgi:voltage-gated potassium channel
MFSAFRRLLIASLVVTALTVVGGVAFWLIGGGRWGLGAALYMAVISVSTVGFGELPGLDAVPGARAVTVGLIVTGIGAIAYLQSTLTAVLIEGTLGHAWRRRAMRTKIEALSRHVIVAGVGATGRHVVEEFVATQTPFVAIDRDQEQLERVSREVAGGAMLYVRGDATEDATLFAAGIARARGLVAALTNDKDNLFVTLSARTLNAGARIVTKVTELEAIPKMSRAGADATVSPNTIGGRRLAGELVRPDVVEFVDRMLRDREHALKLTDVPIPADSPYNGARLGSVPVRRAADVMVVAVRTPDRRFVYSPGPDHVLEAGSALVVLGEPGEARKLEALVRDGRSPAHG